MPMVKIRFLYGAAAFLFAACAAAGMWYEVSRSFPAIITAYGSSDGASADENTVRYNGVLYKRTALQPADVFGVQTQPVLLKEMGLSQSVGGGSDDDFVSIYSVGGYDPSVLIYCSFSGPSATCRLWPTDIFSSSAAPMNTVEDFSPDEVQIVSLTITTAFSTRDMSVVDRTIAALRGGEVIDGSGPPYSSVDYGVYFLSGKFPGLRYAFYYSESENHGYIRSISPWVLKRADAGILDFLVKNMAQTEEGIDIW